MCTRFCKFLPKSVKGLGISSVYKGRTEGRIEEHTPHYIYHPLQKAGSKIKLHIRI